MALIRAVLWLDKEGRKRRFGPIDISWIKRKSEGKKGVFRVV